VRPDWRAASRVIGRLVPDVFPPRGAVTEAVVRALAEDVGPDGDLTAALVPAGATGTLAIVARQQGVIAGQRCAEETFAQVSADLVVTWHRPDGAVVRPGDIVAEVSGPLRAILTGERTALNFLGHLSGIATETRRYVDAVNGVDASVAVLDTRKTTPGLRVLEKAAVRAGGGRNHRTGLSDAVLVKDNHLGAMTITEAVTRARAAAPGVVVEVECDRPDQVAEACAAGADAVLLDNMTPDGAAACASLVRAAPGGGAILVEVSGGVTLETVAQYAATGIDVVSVGALTHSVHFLDLGLDLTTDPAAATPTAASPTTRS
jgi:nicotinate-nucleotide pyrophosphorylase (carboxylating)